MRIEWGDGLGWNGTAQAFWMHDVRDGEKIGASEEMKR